MVEKASLVIVFCSSHEKEKPSENLGRESGRAVSKVPNSILVQKMSSRASGRMKTYEPETVPFENYKEVSVENIKEAC